MRGKLVWGVVGILALGACGGRSNTADTTATVPPGLSRIIAAADTVDVTIGVRCTGSGIDVDVDRWVVDLDSDGALVFNVINKGNNPTLVPEVDIKSANKPGAQWPFAGGFPGRITPGQPKGVGRATGKTNGPAYYAIKVVCGTGANRQTVEIDPDIIVN